MMPLAAGVHHDRPRPCTPTVRRGAKDQATGRGNSSTCPRPIMRGSR
jgi:hypothetical protein